MNHKLVDVIEFENPIHSGDGYWDEDHEKDHENQDDDLIDELEEEEGIYDDDYDESEINNNKLCEQ